jgi:hypothetical protein
MSAVVNVPNTVPSTLPHVEASRGSPDAYTVTSDTPKYSPERSRIYSSLLQLATVSRMTTGSCCSLTKLCTRIRYIKVIGIFHAAYELPRLKIDPIIPSDLGLLGI